MRHLSWASIVLLSHLHHNAASASDSSTDHAQAAYQKPLGVRKMTTNEDEMFFLSYYLYSPLDFRSDRSLFSNSTSSLLSPALPPHSSSSSFNLFKRAWQCPTGTNPCTSINQPNSCCATSETCILVTDTGLGPVGCCPSGQSCAGEVAPCATSQGYSSCPGSPNGGCCIPGYACQGVGCVLTGTTSVAGQSTSTSTSTVVVQPSVSVQTETITVVESASQITVTQTSTVIISPTTESATPVAPVRPTSDTTTITITSPSSSTTSNTPSPTTTTSTTTASSPPTTTTDNASCPTNFYRCSAFYDAGACCRVGRDCSSTSCPPLASSTYTTDGQATVVIVTSGAACANGWASCAPSLGGGCCPSGYGCGSETCTASPTASSGTRRLGVGWMMEVVAVMAVIVWGLY